MKVLDLNGNLIKNVTETAELKNIAEEKLIKHLDTIIKQVASILEDYKEFESFSEALSVPLEEFQIRMESLKKIVKVGTLESHFLGITQEEDYTDMRKDLLKEMMYYIETHPEDNN